MSRFWETMLRDCEEPGKVIEELRGHLQALLAIGSVSDRDGDCPWCGHFEHREGCPWMAAKTYMDQLDA